MHWKQKCTHGIAHETSLDLETETETKFRAISRLETETETQEMPETRPRRESRLVSVREMVETESLADPWYRHIKRGFISKLLMRAVLWHP